MSSKPRSLPPTKTAPGVFPMKPTEVRDLATLLAQRNQIEGQIRGVLMAAKARLGLAIDANLGLNLDECAFYIPPTGPSAPNG